MKLETFEAFTKHYRKFLREADFEERKAMIKKIIKRIEIGPQTQEKNLKIEWIIDQAHFERELALAERAASGVSYFFTDLGSNTLTFGARRGT